MELVALVVDTWGSDPVTRSVVRALACRGALPSALVAERTREVLQQVILSW